MLDAHLLGEADQIELPYVGLYEIRLGRRQICQLADFHLAVLRQRAHRNNAAFITGAQCQRGIDRRPHLEHGACAGLDSKLE